MSLAALRKKGKMDVDGYMKERNYKQVIDVRQQNDREERRLQHSLYSKHGMQDIHRWNMMQIEESQAHIQEELLSLRNTSTTTWGFLPPRPGRQGDPPPHNRRELYDPFEKSFAAEKLFKKSRSSKSSKRQSPVFSLNGADNDKDAEHIPLKTTHSSPGNLESIANIDMKKAKKNIFDRLSKPKKNTGMLDPAAEKPPMGKKLPQKSSKTVVYNYDKYNANFSGSDSGASSPDYKPGFVYDNSKITAPISHAVVFNIVHEEVDEEDTGVLFYKPPTGRKMNHKANTQVVKKQNIIKSVAYRGSIDNNEDYNNNTEKQVSSSGKSVTYADDVIKGDTKSNVRQGGVTEPDNDNTDDINNSKNNDTTIKKPTGPRALTPIKESPRDPLPPTTKREKSRQYSFARSSTKGSFLSGSSKEAKKKKVKPDSRLPGEEEIERNSDGSLRTMNAMPDFNDMVKEALNARYLRTRKPIWFEREISVSEVWKDRDKPLKQKLRLS